MTCDTCNKREIQVICSHCLEPAVMVDFDDMHRVINARCEKHLHAFKVAIRWG